MPKLSGSDRVFILTGAGISAESGIPTFRGAGGLWKNYRVEEVACPEAWDRDPHLVWEFYSMRRRVALAAEPNAGHRAIADLQHRLQERCFLCTQNVDDLHERAGSDCVIHMHGELFKSRCDTCTRSPFSDRSTYDPPTNLPRCDCGGTIRPHICWFGETPFELDRIFRELDQCTVFLAVGTSGLVQPAATFAARAQRRARTIYVGPEKPDNAYSFSNCVLGKAGEILPQLFAEF